MIVKTFVIYFFAALGELGGTYAFWRWLKGGGSAYLALAGMAALLFYAVVQTYQPEGAYGRVYAAYAGVFLVGAMLWGWVIDGKMPDRFDFIGAAITMVGVVVVIFGRRIFA
jgi:small multidrug resistance family-3 protein